MDNVIEDEDNEHKGEEHADLVYAEELEHHDAFICSYNVFYYLELNSVLTWSFSFPTACKYINLDSWRN